MWQRLIPSKVTKSAGTMKSTRVCILSRETKTLLFRYDRQHSYETYHGLIVYFEKSASYSQVIYDYKYLFRSDRMVQKYWAVNIIQPSKLKLVNSKYMALKSEMVGRNECLQRTQEQRVRLWLLSCWLGMGSTSAKFQTRISRPLPPCYPCWVEARVGMYLSLTQWVNWSDIKKKKGKNKE